MEFNLGLDINDLHQEVRNLPQLRQILAAKAFVTRGSPPGSLMHMVREFFVLFQAGYRPQRRTNSTPPQDKQRSSQSRCATMWTTTMAASAMK